MSPPMVGATPAWAPIWPDLRVRIHPTEMPTRPTNAIRLILRIMCRTLSLTGKQARFRGKLRAVRTSTRPEGDRPPTAHEEESSEGAQGDDRKSQDVGDLGRTGSRS